MSKLCSATRVWAMQLKGLACSSLGKGSSIRDQGRWVRVLIVRRRDIEGISRAFHAEVLFPSKTLLRKAVLSCEPSPYKQDVAGSNPAPGIPPTP
jgi:hypothetical protein